jgi:hypothetical protein
MVFVAAAKQRSGKKLDFVIARIGYETKGQGAGMTSVRRLHYDELATMARRAAGSENVPAEWCADRLAVFR